MMIINRNTSFNKLGLTLLLLVLVVPFLGVIHLLNNAFNGEARLIARQQIGVAYIKAVRTLLEQVQQHRGMTNAYLNGASEFAPQLAELAPHIDETAREITQLRGTLGNTPQANENRSAWQDGWRTLRQQNLQMDPDENFDAHTGLINELLSTIQGTADTFQLMLNSNLDSRYLAETIIHLPQQIEDIGQARGLGVGIVARGRISNQERLRMRATRQSISTSMDRLGRNMTLLFERHPSVKARLMPVLDKSMNDTSKFLIFMHQELLKFATPRGDSSTYFIAGTTALDSIFHLFDTAGDELNRLLLERRQEVRREQTLLGISTLLVLAVTLAIYLLFLRHQAARQHLWRKLQQTVTALTESKQKVQTIVENAADGIITIDSSGIIDSFNLAAEHMFGYAANEVIGHKVNCLMPEPQHGEHDTYLQRYLETGEGHIIGMEPREVLAQHRDGTTFPMELAVGEMRQADGKRLFIGILRDITRRKQAEAELRASEERFELVTRGTKDGIWDWDLSTDQIYFSPRWKTMLDYQEDELINNFATLQTLIHPDDLGIALDSWTTCMDGETDAFSVEYRLKNSHDSYTWIRCRGMALHDDNGHPVRIAGSHTDISVQKQTLAVMEHMQRETQAKAEALEHSNKELDQFAYIASHDLKAPLRAIANLSQWIEEDLEETMTDDVRKQMALLRGRVQRLEGLINGILQYSRVGQVDMKTEMVDTTLLLAEVLDGQVLPPGLEIDVALDIPCLVTAPIPLSRVFDNLLSNAIKYHDHPETGHIAISAQNREDGHYEFSVTDDGPGIAPEFHDKVFQIFQTLNARDTVESTGVGLTVVKKIIEQMGGEIVLESAAGEGSTFRFTLPKDSNEEHAANNKQTSIKKP